MTAPGWYNAEGDPAGSQRYWDGTQWIGEPVYEPAAAPGPAMYPAPVAYPPPVGYQPPPASSFPGALKTLAIVVSVLKAIPLLFGLLAVVLFGALAGGLDDDDFGSDFDGVDELFGFIAAFLLVLILIGALLIGFQFAGALKERPMMILVPALIMSILDSLGTVGSWVGFASSQGNSFDNPSPGGPVLITAITAAQIAVVVMAIKAKNS